jgi:phage recombination protein Bet
VSNVAIIEPRQKSVMLDMSDRFGMEPAAFEATLRSTVVPKECSREQLAAFLLIAKEYKLNPLLKEIYAFPAKGGGIQPIVGVDGWANLINSHTAFDGMDFEDHFNDSGELVSITCRMHRKDRSHPVTATEYLAECKRSTEPWTKWPRRMLRHKAMIQAARYAFSFAGIVDPDEAERFSSDLAREVQPRPSLAERLTHSTARGDGFSIEHVELETSQPATGDASQGVAHQEPESQTSGSPNSNSSQDPASKPPETDKPAVEDAPTPAAAGTLSESASGSGAEGGGDGVSDASPSPLPSDLSPDWRETYLRAMARVNDRPKSLPSRHTEALQLIGGKANAEEQEWMKAVYSLTKRRLQGEITKEDFDAAIREIS